MKELYKKQLPDGVQDYIGRECYNKRQLEAAIRARLLMSGYDEVESPSFEYYDVFASGIGSVRQESMFKLFDASGRILVLRPDLTMPIARIAATKLLGDLPQKLFYIGNAYGCEDAFYSTQKEFSQAGLELLGIKGPEADAQMIAEAIEILLECGLASFQIDIGQVEFFKGMMEEAGLSGEEAEALRDYVDQKNNLAAELMLGRLNVGAGVRERIAGLSSLYGGEEVFCEAARHSSYPRCVRAIDDLRRVYTMLCDFGFKRYLSIDLGMLQSIDYYSGIVFKGISGDLGQPLLTGGRYDKLIGEFGADIPATGFALGIKRLMIALEKQGSLVEMPAVQAVVSGERRCLARAYEAMVAMRGEGMRVEAAFYLGREELSRYAKKLGARAVYVEE